MPSPHTSTGWKQFKYSSSLDFRTYETIQQPILKVKLQVGSVTMPTQMLVDSGAQDILIHADLALVLGIDLSTCPTQAVGGITGVRDAYKHTVDIYIEQFKEPLTVEALFVPEMGINGLLGQVGFFDQFYVNFDKSKLDFSLKKLPKLDTKGMKKVP